MYGSAQGSILIEVCHWVRADGHCARDGDIHKDTDFEQRCLCARELLQQLGSILIIVTLLQQSTTVEITGVCRNIRATETTIPHYRVPFLGQPHMRPPCDRQRNRSALQQRSLKAEEA
jgi:hypothetical protein